MKKYFWHILGISTLSFFVGVFLSYFVFSSESIFHILNTVKAQDSELKNSANVSQTIPTDDFKLSTTTLDISDNLQETVSIGFVGDIVPAPNASSGMFDGVISYTNRPDIMVGNLEGAITEIEYSKCKDNSKKCFAFNGDEKFLKLLRSSSFDVLNTSNNHFNDYGEGGRKETIRKIKESGIIPVGMKDEITYIDKNNIKISIVGFSTSWWAGDLNDEETVEKNIIEAGNNSDIVVVVFHAGGEGEIYAHTPNQTEWYLGENRGNVRSFAHKAIDSGADIVLGSGPHVLRGIEKYKGKLIAYSLGNFASASDKILNTGSLKNSAMIEVTLNNVGSFISGKVYPLEINSQLEPYPDTKNTTISFMNDLSKNDFGDRGVIIDPSGEIIFK